MPVDVPFWRRVNVPGLCAAARVIAFDLDNTLASSKQPMSPTMAQRISQLTTMIPVAIITGGYYELVVSQILDVLDDRTIRERMYVMPTRGTRLYVWQSGHWRQLYSLDLSEHDRNRARACIERHARDLGLWEPVVWGPRFEDRGSQLTFSALGQSAPEEAKRSWDPTNRKKQELSQAVAADLPGLSVHPGGYSSVDVSQTGIDKAYAIGRLCSVLGVQPRQVIFVGDRMDPDGNDYPAALAGTMALRVRDPQDTLMLCDQLIFQQLGSPSA